MPLTNHEAHTEARATTAERRVIHVANEERTLPQITLDLADTLRRRNVAFGQPDVAMLPAPDEDLTLVPPGSVGLFMGWPRSRLFGDLRRAAVAGDRTLAGAADRAVEATESALNADTPVAQSFEDIPLFGDFRYGGRTLATGLFVTQTVEVMVAAVLYNGGPLDADRFQLVSYARETGTVAEALVVVNPPELSDLEARLLESVPATHAEFNMTYDPHAVPAVVATIVAREGIRRGAMWAAETVAAAGVGWGVGKGLDAAWDKARGSLHALDERGVSADDVDPTASAQELLDARVQALRTRPPRRPYAD